MRFICRVNDGGGKRKYSLLSRSVDISNSYMRSLRIAFGMEKRHCQHVCLLHCGAYRRSAVFRVRRRGCLRIKTYIRLHNRFYCKRVYRRYTRRQKWTAVLAVCSSGACGFCRKLRGWNTLFCFDMAVLFKFAVAW